MWNDAGRSRRLVGIVENPEDLHDGFALVSPGQAPGFEPPERPELAIEGEGSLEETAERVVSHLRAAGLLDPG